VPAGAIAVPTLKPGGEVKLEDPSLGVEGYITIYAPSDYTPDRTWPAVVCYHGLNNPPTTWPFRQALGGKGFVVIGMPYYGKDMAANDTVGVDIANLRRFLPVFIKQLNLDTRQLFIGGFSQGGFMTDEIGTATAGMWAGLAIMGAGRHSGMPATGFKGKPVYIGAGEKDGNLTAAQRAAEAYKAAGADVTFETYAGLGHAVNQNSKVLADWLWDNGPLKLVKADMTAAKAAQAAGKLGQAYVKFKAVAAVPGGQDIGKEAAAAAEAIGTEAETQLTAADTAVTEKRYSEAGTLFAAVAAKYDGSPFAERAQKGLAALKSDPTIKAAIAQAQVNAAAKALNDQAQAAETAKDYGKAIALYGQLVKSCPTADVFAAAKTRLEALQADKTIQADLHGKDAERECRAWLSMADNFQKAGATDKAKEYLQKILDKYADTTWGAEAKKRMAAM
jgi:predicted esterase